MNDCITILQNYIQRLQDAYNQGILYDYIINNALDIYLEVGLDGNLRDYHIVLATGGPSIELQYGKIVCYDWNKTKALNVPRHISDEIWSYIEQMKGF